MSVVAIIVARNEEKHLGDTISSLLQQNFKDLLQIIVIDDGSTDKTATIALNLGCEVIQLPYHKESLIAKPQLAERWNRGFIEAMKYEPDFIFTSGADHQFPQ